MLPADASQPRSPRRIVIVDDNVDAGEALATLLELDGHTVTVHPDAQSALADVDAGADADAWLLDIGLPRIDGYELARRLRARRPRALLIALTGYGQADDRERARDAGFDHHFVKPVEPGALERVLAGASGQQPPQR